MGRCHSRVFLAGIQGHPLFSRSDFVIKVTPSWILFLDPPQFPSGIPLLNLFLPLNCRPHRFVYFKANEKMDFMFLRKTLHPIRFVLPYAFDQVASHTGL